MSRYIDADKVLAYISRLLGVLPLALLNEYEKNGIDIVRCKECIFRNQKYLCQVIETDDDDFCSYGEREDK